MRFRRERPQLDGPAVRFRGLLPSAGLLVRQRQVEPPFEVPRRDRDELFAEFENQRVLARAAGPVCQTFEGNRSGDFSYIALWPAAEGGCQANEFAILEGEVSLGTNWGTRIAAVRHC